MFLLVLALSFSSAWGVDLPHITDRGFIELCLHEHNRARSDVRPPASDMRFMSWDSDLAAIARSWARRCVFEHSPLPSSHPMFSGLGENLWVYAPPSHFSVTYAVRRWVNETVDYSYHHNSCGEGRMCGHYTQVVWARSYKVGCAVHVCDSGIYGATGSEPAANFVCNYGPAGNVIGQRPYQTNGNPCSECDAEDSCLDRLCRNTGRDEDKSSRWGAAEESSASDFLPVLITRPVALLGSVIAALAVRHFFPDVFCYE